MEWIIIISYCLALGFIFVFSMVQLHLTYTYIRTKKKSPTAERINDWPSVTIQLPVYNEKYVIQRLLESVSAMDYPKDKLEIQILDDSTDETSEIIRNFAENSNSNVKHIQRVDRTGFKAGALQEGLQICEGEFIAIFDSDFMPEPDFLKRTIPHFRNGIGMVQTRWGHLNRKYSLLTKLQAFGLDAHFTVEQVGRKFSNSFISFNGTGGVWRKQCIEDAGGWSADTLTEDLDLSYRAQLKGWRFEYLENYSSPAELPVIMPAIKSQQYRWNKGAAETARKNLKKIFGSSMSKVNKIHATFHLLNSSVFVFLLIAALLSIPMLYIKQFNPELSMLFNLGSIFLLGFFSIGWFYWVSTKAIAGKRSFVEFIKTFPLFLMVSMGLSLHNGMAVLEGLFGRKTPFIRTPKFNVVKQKDSWKGNKYVKRVLKPATLIEGLLSLYFIYGIWTGISINDWGLIIFHLMLAIGFGMVFLYSINPLRNA